MTNYLQLYVSSRSQDSTSKEAKKKTHTLQNVQTDTTQLVDIWMIDLGEKSNLGRRHGVIVREKELKLKNPAYVLSAAYLLPSMPRLSIPSYGD